MRAAAKPFKKLIELGKKKKKITQRTTKNHKWKHGLEAQHKFPITNTVSGYRVNKAQSPQC